MSDSKCNVCGRGIWDRALYRVNEIGVLPAIWACQEHVPQGKEPEDDVLHITRVIEDDNRRRRR